MNVRFKDCFSNSHLRWQHHNIYFRLENPVYSIVGSQLLSVYHKSEQIVKILDTADSCSLLFIGQKGTAVYRNSRLQVESEFHWNLCPDVPSSTSCHKSRKASFSVTDAVYMGTSGHYCIATSNRTLHFMHASPGIQWETFRITEFPTVPTCLESTFHPKNKEKTCELFIGDHKGGIYILTFFFPSTMLFLRNYSLDTQVIRFHDLHLHESYVKWERIKNVHFDLVSKLQYISQRKLLFSSSNIDSRRRLVSYEMTSSRMEAYRHPAGITCFVCNRSLNVVATGSKDFSIRIFNIGCFSKTDSVLTGHKAVISDVKIYSNKTLVSICKEGEMRTWNMSSYMCLHRFMLRVISFPSPAECGLSIIHVPCHHSNRIIVTFRKFVIEIDLNSLKEYDYVTLK